MLVPKINTILSQTSPFSLLMLLVLDGLQESITAPFSYILG